MNHKMCSGKVFNVSNFTFFYLLFILTLAFHMLIVNIIMNINEITLFSISYPLLFLRDGDIGKIQTTVFEFNLKFIIRKFITTIFRMRFNCFTPHRINVVRSPYFENYNGDITADFDPLNF